MNKNIVLLLLIALSFTILCIAPFVGESLNLSEILSMDRASTDYHIFFNMRLPRVLLAFIAGAALAVCGMTFQSLFRNDLASPFTLGIASGASFAVVLYLFLGGPILFFSFISGTSIVALFGATLALSVMYCLIKFKKNISLSEILLAGVALNFFFSSLILILQFKSQNTQLGDMLHWMIGGVQIFGYDNFNFLLIFTTIGFILMIKNLREMDLLLTGEDLAQSRGVNLKQVRKELFFAVSLIVGAVVAICGPIGFIGLMIPHLCRKIFGTQHQTLFYTCFIVGGLFLVICDTVARTLFYPSELPVGLITSSLGAPFFFWLVIKKKN